MKISIVVEKLTPAFAIEEEYTAMPTYADLATTIARCIHNAFPGRLPHTFTVNVCIEVPKVLIADGPRNPLVN